MLPKKIYYFVFLIFLAFLSNAQTKESLLQWKINYNKVEEHIYQITATTTIPKSWHLYGNNKNIDGLLPVTITTEFENDSVLSPVVYNKEAIIINDILFENKAVAVFEGTIEIKQQVKFIGEVPTNISGTIEAFLANQNNFKQDAYTFQIQLQENKSLSQIHQVIKIESIDKNNPLNDCGEKSVKNNSLGITFLLGFLGGLLALLTPCVFPMIPVTVSFFTKRSNNTSLAIRNGLLYGFFIFIIYLSASIPFHLLDNIQPEIFNQISTNAYVNIIFFLVFIIFAFSFFGFFEITLPSSIANKADSKSGLGSMGGIFFMAFTLAIVSFSCTGPILGTLLVGTAGNGAWQLTSGLAGFGLALALPFALFAIFPSWLQSLPKSGGWLGTVKKVLAFVELALALKFLSQADLVMHWGLLKREVFFAIWIVISAVASLYLLGVVKFLDEKNTGKLSLTRKIIGLVFLVFTLYLLPGITNTKYANLNLVSGFPPPLSYSIFGKENASLKGLEPNVINNYKQALQLAQQQHKPLLIDFTGWACVNCRKMEENVWTNTEVYQYIKDNYILVSLYVDDKQKLPVPERFVHSTPQGLKEINTIGDLWATFETENFAIQSQPLYVLIDNKERLLTNAVGYTPNATEYLNWLRCGKNTFDTDLKSVIVQ